ncbi:hypothetical protein BpHYR1_031523 [Brachionus plicatilis]|uniref:Uncharacterized protein n=1 Tax=Brachionus plicatilis TaxID=10195 RepID=A0A3M7T1S1_BRAPC|nr:hypothetical protein BpHYR1_031523 [Brachionus plicatilis]
MAKLKFEIQFKYYILYFDLDLKFQFVLKCTFLYSIEILGTNLKRIIKKQFGVMRYSKFYHFISKMLIPILKRTV